MVKGTVDVNLVVEIEMDFDKNKGDWVMKCDALKIEKNGTDPSMVLNNLRAAINKQLEGSVKPRGIL